MQISEVRVRPIYGEGRVRALASITFANAFVVHELRVVDGQKGLFISMPSRRKVSGEYVDIAHPITSGAREQVEQKVLEAYAKAVGTAAATQQAAETAG